ncbi:hypothetical protein BDW74DRAFT_147402 [Aspergillus multicolor]|uniref:uncharacterized protein n=1 Tax=Aspergillus multicolor TaxID=41759 RepID=UPI003CCD2690
MGSNPILVNPLSIFITWFFIYLFLSLLSMGNANQQLEHINSAEEGLPYINTRGD